MAIDVYFDERMNSICAGRSFVLFMTGKWWDCAASGHAEMSSVCWSEDQLWARGSDSDEEIWQLRFGISCRHFIPITFLL